MSFCRFSSNDFHCDIYAYADVDGGYTCHVAHNRVLGDVPPLIWPADGDGSYEAFTLMASSYRAQMTFLATADHETIDLPHAGATFRVDTAQELLNLLLMLQTLGYNFPDDVLSSVLAEIDEPS